MTPERLLRDEEWDERQTLDLRRYAQPLRYFRFAESFSWDKETVDRQDFRYLADMESCIVARAKSQNAMNDKDRRDLEKQNDAEDPTTRGKSLTEIRDLYAPLMDDWSDDSVCEYIGRGKRRSRPDRQED